MLLSEDSIQVFTPWQQQGLLLVLLGAHGAQGLGHTGHVGQS